MALHPPELLDLLERIKDHPDDDGLRLLLADTLERQAGSEAEQARAVFIRLQCQLAALAMNDPARPPLAARVQEIQDTHAIAWLQDWQPWLGKAKDLGESWWFHRGLLRLGLSSLQCWVDVPPERAAWDWVDGLSVCGMAVTDLQQLLAHSISARLNHLWLRPRSFWGVARAEEAALALAASPHPTRLTTLDLTLLVIGPKGASALAATPHLARLTSLVLWAAAIQSEGAEALAQAPSLSRLEALDLGSYDVTPCNDIGDEGIQALACSPHLVRLKRLDLMENRIGAQGVRALAASANFRELTHLNLSGNEVDLDGARALASSPHLARLAYLMIGGYGFLDEYPDRLTEAAEILLSSPRLPNLTRLDIGYPTYGEPTAATIEACRRRFGGRLVWRDGQSGLDGIEK